MLLYYVVVSGYVLSVFRVIACGLSPLSLFKVGRCSSLMWFVVCCYVLLLVGIA